MSMPLSEVQRINATPGQLSEIAVAGGGRHVAGTSSRALSRALGGTAEVRTGEEQADKASADITDSLGFLTIALLVFAGIAVFVGGFLIFNTFAVTVAQRSREFALLRTLGASRRQVLNSVVVETLVIGFVASVVGILGGLVIAPGLRALLSSVGIDLPSTGTVIEARTIIVALAVGMIATLVSGLVPARRATQVEPVEAMREAGTPGAKKVSRRRLISSFAVIALGLVALIVGLFGAERLGRRLAARARRRRDDARRRAARAGARAPARARSSARRWSGCRASPAGWRARTRNASRSAPRSPRPR